MNLNKICCICKQSKLETEFHWKWKDVKRHYHCKVCEAIKDKIKYHKFKDRYVRISVNGSRKKKYGITEDDYNNLLKNQKYSCKICKKHQSNFKQQLAVDHCHKTKKIRGLLCNNCNNGLGRFKDLTVILGNAIEYLQKSDLRRK